MTDTRLVDTVEMEEGMVEGKSEGGGKSIRTFVGVS